MQGTRVQHLAGKNPRASEQLSPGAMTTEPTSCNDCAHTPESLCSPTREAPTDHNQRKPECSHEDPVQPKKKKKLQSKKLKSKIN